MNPVFNASTFIFLITVVLCFVAGLILFVFSKNKMVNNRWLAAFYLFAGYGFLVAFVLYSRLIFEFPWYHIYRTGYISAFLLMPLSFFYIRSLIQQKKFRAIDLIHFLPITIFITDFIPFYTRSAEYKLGQLAIDTQGLNTIWNEFSQGWLGIGFIYVPLRMVLTAFYWLWQVRMIVRSGKLKEGQNLIAENSNIIIWAKILCASQVLFFVPYFINASFGNQQNLFFVLHVLLAIAISITILILIMKPTILYGLKGMVVRNFAGDSAIHGTVPVGEIIAKPMNVATDIQANTAEAIREKADGEIYLSSQKLTSIGKKVSEHILQERSYLKRGYTSARLAAEMNMQPYILSAVINQVFKTNYNDFINGYRVNHAKKLIQEGEARLQTLEGLSELCGFNNRNSFTIAFKKHTGRTPSDFIKQAYPI